MAGQPIIPLDYELIAGKHFFTAATELGRGLCVAHSGLKTAFDEVGKQLKVILPDNHGFELADDVEDLVAFEEFQRFVSATPGRSKRIKSKRFAVAWRARKLGPSDS